MSATVGHRGTAYLLVLVTVMVTVAIGASSVMVHGSRRARLARAADMERARAVAQAGLELATAYVQSDIAWRANRGLGTWMSEEPVLDGFVTVVASDDDGDAKDDPTDRLTLESEGVVGAARQIVSITLEPVPIAMDCLDYASSSGDQAAFQGMLNANAPVAANSSMGALLATVRPDVYAGGSISGLSYTGTKYANSGTREHPAATTALDWYIANGTAIAFGSLPSSRIRSVVLGPNNNPYGSTNARGIYVIDCGGSSITIRECRIEGTLVLLNPGSLSKIERNVNWKPADPSLPALLVKGRITIELLSASLSEPSLGVNFNPITAPYAGASDSDTSDTYPSRLEGLLYATDDFTIQGSTTILGQVVAGDDITYDGTVSITTSPGYADAPPAGFVSRYNMLMDVGSLARVFDE
jgi:hypothetical protein